MVTDPVPSRICGPSGADMACSDSSDSDGEGNECNEGRLTGEFDDTVAMTALYSGDVSDVSDAEWSMSAIHPVSSSGDDSDAEAEAMYLGAPRKAAFLGALFAANASSKHCQVDARAKVSRASLSRSPERQTKVTNECMNITPPRRRQLVRHETGERQPAPQHLRRQLVACAKTNDKALEKSPMLEEQRDDMAEASQQKFQQLTPDDVDYSRNSLTLFDQALFLEVNRRPRSRSPPFART